MRAVATTPPTPRPGRASWVAGRRLAVVLVVALALVALSLGLAVRTQERSAGALDAARADLVTVRAEVLEHARVMRAQGESLLAAAETSTSTHRDHVRADARSMIADASRLDATASLLASQAALLGEHPGRSVRSDLSFIRSAGEGLVSEGDGLVAHARTVSAHADAMEALRGEGADEITAREVALLRDEAGRLGDAGRRTGSLGVTLRDVGTQLMRSIGR